MHTSRYNSLSQLTLAVAGFALTSVLLQSEALVEWAQQLEVSQTAAVAVLATSTVQRAIKPLSLGWFRRASLAMLDRVGWRDDPARLETVRSARIAGPAPCAGSAAAGFPFVVNRSPFPFPGATVPILPGVPAQTALTPLPPLAAGKHRVVALVGDSMMAVGLSDILLRQTATNENLHVVKAFRSGTGLARPDVFDWTKEYPAMIGPEHPDAIFVAIGANDGQGFLEDGKVLVFGSDAWVRAYQQRIATFLDLLTQENAHVVWVGLPPMKNEQYNRKIAEINRIAYTVVSRSPHAVWWNPASRIGDETGSFREFGNLPDGKTARLRAPDGIHFSDEGATLLTSALLEWLNTGRPAQTAQNDPPTLSGKSRNRKEGRKFRR